MDIDTTETEPVHLTVREAKTVEWMARYLKNGPKRAGEARAAAKAEGLALGPLCMAREFLNVRSRKYRWELPPGPIPKYEVRKRAVKTKK